MLTDGAADFPNVSAHNISTRHFRQQKRHQIKNSQHANIPLAGTYRRPRKGNAGQWKRKGNSKEPQR